MPPRPNTAKVRVRELLDALPEHERLTLRSGEAGIDRALIDARVQKNGLCLAGHLHGVAAERVQIFGETELSYLETLDEAECLQRLRSLFALSLSLVVVTRGVDIPEVLIECARETDTPLASAGARSSSVIGALHDALDKLFTPRETRHGVLIDVHGTGVLLTGPSGIGKSECALFLVERGHRLVADDQVVLVRRKTGEVLGHAPDLLRDHLELRGVGIINVRELFGATAVRKDVHVQLVVELSPHREGDPYERLGLEDQTIDLLGDTIPLLEVPVQPGRNMAVILEVAVRNEMLKRTGRHSAREFVQRLSQR